MDTSGWNMYVFRDGRRFLPGCDQVRGVKKAIEAAAQAPDSDKLITALLAAGELACALADVHSPHTIRIEEITDQLARAFVRVSSGRAADLDKNSLVTKLGLISAPDRMRVSVHEGFAYYALHPVKFARVIDEMSLDKRVVVVGIRSIGLTLGAVTLAALRDRGFDAERITVRPMGHPYDRTVELGEREKQWVAEWKGAEFLVVDEGPGLSGSSFIATGEALMRAGVSPNQITLVGTRLPDVNGLRTTDAARRWRQFKAVAVEQAPILPDGADIALGGGAWREELLRGRKERPGSWTQLERLKYVSKDGRRFFRFEGYGQFGAQHAERAKLVAARGFGPGYVESVNGFGCYEFVKGTPLNADQATDEVLDRIAAYCAFRAREFPEVIDQPSDLENMLRFNWRNEFGAEIEGGPALEPKKAIVTDSRMMPHKWLRTGTGEILKVDSTSHGDDHFFPGPCDIAWDLAGTIVEWELSPEATKYFLVRYQQLSGDEPRSRIGSYLLAYATFRLAYSRMAARAMGGTPEEPLLIREYERYRLQALEIHREYIESPNAHPRSTTESGDSAATTVA